MARPAAREIGRKVIPPSRVHWGVPTGAEAHGAGLPKDGPSSETGDYWVYILTNARRTVLYIGVTNGLLKRLVQHALAKHSGFTKRYFVDTLIYFENFHEVKVAIAREKQLKRWSRVKKEWLIQQMNPGWVDLGRELFGDGAGSLDCVPRGGTSLGMTRRAERERVDADDVLRSPL